MQNAAAESQLLLSAAGLCSVFRPERYLSRNLEAAKIGLNRSRHQKPLNPRFSLIINKIRRFVEQIVAA